MDHFLKYLREICYKLLGEAYVFFIVLICGISKAA